MPDKPVTPAEWRDALEDFLHAYLLDNEPQVHPRGLAFAVWGWLHGQSPPYQAAIDALAAKQEECERLREAAQQVVSADAALDGASPAETVRLAQVLEEGIMLLADALAAPQQEDADA